MKIIVLLAVFVVSTHFLSAQQGMITRTSEKAEDLIDDRDGQVYGTVKYVVIYPDKTSDSFTWMTENLNYKMDNSYCYNDTLINCETYGRLYTWEAAQQACPSGWHLPSDEDWYHLAFHFGGNCKCGAQLKSESSLWLNATSRGTNTSFFNALPAGLGSRSGTYHRLGWMTIFWSSNERDQDSAWDWKLTGGNELQRWHGSKNARNGVRCVKD